jgi:hypothetical protein
MFRCPTECRLEFMTGIFISSNILGSIFQIASLPVIILAPLGAVSLLWNAFFSRLLLGDRFHQFIIVGTFLIVGGAVMIAIGGIVPEPTHSLEDLLTLFRRKAFIVYFALLGSGLGILLIIVRLLRLFRGVTKLDGLISIDPYCRLDIYPLFRLSHASTNTTGPTVRNHSAHNRQQKCVSPLYQQYLTYPDLAGNFIRISFGYPVRDVFTLREVRS